MDHDFPPADVILKSACQSQHWQAAFFCSYSAPTDTDIPFSAVVYYATNVAKSPFNGKENPFLVAVIKECLKVGKPHEHGIKNLGLSNVIKRHGKGLHHAAVVTFLFSGNASSGYCLLGFPKDNIRDPERVNSAENYFSCLSEIAQLQSRAFRSLDILQKTEVFVREVGHDLAGCFQAMMAKLRYISDGDLNESAMREKALEALRELESAFGIADGLGITVDSNYELRSRDKITFSELFEKLKTEYEAEAAERNIRINCGDPKGATIKGDYQAVKTALGHLLLNAIKYANSDTSVDLGIRPDSQEVIVSIRNQGIGLPKNVESYKFYELGYRSSKARELHVNGSGVGLFTAKKIALAHQGRIWLEDTKGVTVCCMSFPRLHRHR